jgi:PAS domain S-box-containing protein
MTYNDLFGPNYIFMSSYDGTMLVQPYEPALEGTNQVGLTDARGLRIIESLIATAREGSGFVTYDYHPPDRPAVQRKVSYVMGITELDAYIGTGMYSEDLGNSFTPFLTRLYTVCILVFALILLTLYLFLRPMFVSYRQLLSAFRRTGKTPEHRRLLDVSPYRKGSEAESLISGFNAMLADIQQTIEDRKQVELQLQQAHMELTANHEEVMASNEELSALYEQVASTNEALHVQYKELKASEALLEMSEERYRLALEGANDTIFDWDLRTNRLTWTARWSEALGLPTNELSGALSDLREWIHPDDRERQDNALIAHLHGKTPYYVAEFRIRTQSGEYIWALARGKALFNEHGQPLRMAGSFTDITEKKQREKQIWNLAYQDVLTGLPNRSLLTEHLSLKLSQGGAGSLFFLDIDNFKLINDSCGHAQGDQLLAETANRLNAVVGPSATVARLGR